MSWIEKITLKNIVGILVAVGCFLNVRFDFIQILTPWSFYVEFIGWLAIIVGFSEYFVPITKKDMKKFVTFSIKFFAIIFIYTIARQIKDTLIISNFRGEGATICKIFVLIVGVIYPLFYQKWINSTSRSKTVYIAMGPFVLYFLLHAFVLYNNTTLIPVITSSNRFLQLLGAWPDVLYYVLAEMFASIVLITYFWQTANHFHNKEECKRVYPAFMIIAQFATMLTSGVTKFLSKSDAIIKNFGYAGVLKITAIIIGILFLITIACNHYFFSDIEHKQEDLDSMELPKSKHTKSNTGFFNIIKENPFYFLVGLLSVYYGICTLWLEQFWKTRAGMIYNTKATYQVFTSNYFLTQSRISLVMTIFGTGILLNYFPWVLNALITPLVVYGSSILLFGFDILKNFLYSNPMKATAFIATSGVFIIGIFKSVKYSSFDTSKEFYLVSKSKSERSKIKEVESYLGRQGKSVTALFMGCLFGCFPSLSYMSTSITVSLLIGSLFMATIWLYTVLKLNQDLQISENNHIENKEVDA